FEIETMMNVRALGAGLKVVEVPSFEDKRVYGQGRLRAIPDGWRVLKTILLERFRHSAKPIERASAGCVDSIQEPVMDLQPTAHVQASCDLTTAAALELSASVETDEDLGIERQREVGGA